MSKKKAAKRSGKDESINKCRRKSWGKGELNQKGKLKKRDSRVLELVVREQQKEKKESGESNLQWQ